MAAAVLADKRTEVGLPWTCQIDRLLERLVSWLPRQSIEVSLTPAGEIEVVPDQDCEFIATGESSRFTLDFPGPYRSGWYYLEAALVRNNGNFTSSLRIGTTTGVANKSVATNQRGSAGEVFQLSANTDFIHWCPTAAPGYFSLSRVRVYRISALEGGLRRLHRVVQDLWRYRGMSSTERAGLTWWGLFTDLAKAYEQSAALRLNRRIGADYTAFVRTHDSLTAWRCWQIRRQDAALARQPLISLILPLRSGNSDLLQQTLESVSVQLYRHWQLLVVSSLPAGNALLEVVRDYTKHELRVVLLASPENEAATGSLASLVNQGVSAAEGEFVLHLTAHDLLPRHALSRIAATVVARPQIRLVYGDDDEITVAGLRQAPRFKPDWNPDLLRSGDYIGSPVAFRRADWIECGGYDEAYAEAEGYALLLRLGLNAPPGSIVHVPEVLYHRQAVRPEPECLAARHAAGKRALAECLARSGAIVADGYTPGLYRVIHRLPESPPLVSIIIPTRDKGDLLRTCIESIQHRTDYPHWQLIIVDNQSREPATLEYLAELQDQHNIQVLRYDQPFNYSAINNYAVQAASGEICVFMNNDVEVIDAGWLRELASQAIRTEVGVVGSKLLYSSGSIQHAGIALGKSFVATHVHRYLPATDPGYCNRAAVVQDISAVTGACMAMRRSVFELCRGFNAESLAVNYNDIDLCLKAMTLGLRNIYTPYAVLYHHESISRGQNDSVDKMELLGREAAYMRETWGTLLAKDRAFNPNLHDKYLSRLVF